MALATTPFHPGEHSAQTRAGVTGLAARVAGFIRPFMPAQHRSFFADLPFLVLAGDDGAGRHWVTLLDGPDGFIGSPDPATLTVDARPDPQDPLAERIAQGGEVGLLGIELATRRRNRLSGVARRRGAGFAIDVRQSFGNCPQYISERIWHRVAPRAASPARASSDLSPEQIARIRAADTLFIGTGQSRAGTHPSNGFDASHRGGAPGFVQVIGDRHLRIPDYAGNNFFNTIGNLLENPAIGLVFVDFDTGGLLHLSGRASIDWDARDSGDPNALRMIDIHVEAVLERPAALSLRWQADVADLRELVVIDKQQEAEDITSFQLAAPDGAPLPGFRAGQYLPIELDIPGQRGPVRRTYSLSGAPGTGTYRLSIKREAQGLASRHLHDVTRIGDRLRARSPAGGFLLPDGSGPVVLVSAGIGLTPMLSMLHELAAQSPQRPVWFLHGARDGAHHAHGAELRTLARTHGAAQMQTHFSRPRAGDQRGRDYDIAGRITAQTLGDLALGPEAQYMLCGPTGFVADLRHGLEVAGVPLTHIHTESFGPAS
ncbi:pyridoxamine 5'-phosphate oxidase family protein [Dinoroseobacter sp. S124A]|uniref:FAD-binding oxidoreductase n=1 Tax=Dinoroseobacter sp. S124A TaxID=3415128 RepID=UPI003C7DF30F